jgi:hypothetical protein
MTDYEKTIFIFWEPKGAMPGYLKLCRKTWEAALSGYRIIDLDYSNLEEYIEPGAFDIPSFKKLRLHMQKDVIMAAVLKKNGGIFLDIDNIVLKDIAPIVRKLRRSQIVSFGMHLGIMAARPQATLFTPWLEGVRERLARLEAHPEERETMNWGHWGNRILEDEMDRMIRDSGVAGAIQAGIGDCVIGALRMMPVGPARVRGMLGRIGEALRTRRRNYFFDTALRHTWDMLDPDEYGLWPEALRDKSRLVRSRTKYLRFWFEGNRSVSDPFHGDAVIIGLHNSWTPEEYMKLTPEEILRDDRLLSRTFRRLLGG